MSIDRDEAATSLNDIADIERRTREAMFYAGASPILILWGVLLAIGNVGGWLLGHHPVQGWWWLGIDVLGFIGTFGILYFRFRRFKRRLNYSFRLAYAALVLLGYAALLSVLLWPLTDRQMAVFSPILVMCGYVLMGLWLGRFFAICGVLITALIVVGYFWIGDWLELWLAAVFGGGLIAGGIWLSRES